MSKMGTFATVVNGYKPLTIVAKFSILYASVCPGFTSEFYGSVCLCSTKLTL